MNTLQIVILTLMCISICCAFAGDSYQESKPCNEKRKGEQDVTRNGKRGVGSGERGTEVWERVVSGNLHKNQLKSNMADDRWNRLKGFNLRWMNTVLRAVSGNTCDGICFKLDKQTRRLEKQWNTEDDFSFLLIKILWYLAECLLLSYFK